MVFGLFLSEKEKVLRLHKSNLQNLISAQASAFLAFRRNAVNKFTFLHPDMKFLVNHQSPYFMGYSKENQKFVTGHFHDIFVPKASELLYFLGTDSFEVRFQEISTALKSHNDLAKKERPEVLWERSVPTLAWPHCPVFVEDGFTYGDKSILVK